jgi:hypothetical protein
MGISQNMELNPAITAAAIISGAISAIPVHTDATQPAGPFAKGPAVADVNDK